MRGLGSRRRPAGRGRPAARVKPCADRPRVKRYLEDFAVGERFTTGAVRVTEREILAFGRKYDSQPIHTDKAAAKASPFGGLIASGLHTLALAFTLINESGVLDDCFIAGIAFKEVRFLKPVRPNDRLAATFEVLGARPSRSRPERGVLRLRTTLTNKRGDVVMSLVSLEAVRRRPRPDA